MIFLLKKATLFIIFILIMFGAVIYANFLAPIFLRFINTTGVLYVFYRNDFTDIYIYLYKNIHAFLLLLIFLTQYIVFKISLANSKIAFVWILIFYLLNNFLSFSGFYWSEGRSNLFSFSYLGAFLSINLIILIKIILYLNRKIGKSNTSV